MSNWIGRKLESAVNFVSRTSEEIGENTGFKLGRNIFRFLFGLPLGVTRLLVVDAPIHLVIFAAKIANTTSFTTLWKDISKKVVDPFYENLSKSAKEMTSNFVKGFMFGPYLEAASWAKEKLSTMEAENFGTTKGDPNSPENIVAKDPTKTNDFLKGEMKKVDTQTGIKPISATPIVAARQNQI